MKNQLSVLLFISSFIPNTAFAHGVFKGLSSFYNGLLHPLFSPPQLFVIIILGLFLGQQTYKKNTAFFSFAIALIIGLLLTPFSITNHSESILLIITLTVSTLVMLKQKIPLPFALLIMLLGGLFLGLDSRPDDLIATEKIAFLLGNAVAVYLLILYPITLAETFNNAFWKTTFIRILGSWLAASALMVGMLTLIGHSTN